MSLTLYRWGSQLHAFFLRLPPLVQVGIIYGASRIWGWLVFLTVARTQLGSPWSPSHPSYLSFISFWDSGWYKQIATSGYPQDLPLDGAGRVRQNTWAFYPLFPLTSSLLSKVTGLSYYQAAATLALVAGFFAAFIIYKLFRLCLSQTRWGANREDAEHHHLALWALALVSFLPVSAVLQVPYAESLNLLFLAWTLLLLVRKKWLLVLPVALLACLSRPVGVPLGAAAGIYWLTCWITRYREYGQANYLGRAKNALRETGTQFVSALIICAFALLWPLLAWMRTGQIDAYTATETAWRGTHLAPLLPWFSQGEVYFGIAGIPLVFALVLGAGLLLASRFVRVSLPPVLIIWCASYLGYLLLFLNPQSSTFRLLLPLFPLVLPLVRLSASRAYRWLLILSGAAGQLWWVSWLWHWKQLPGGGDYPP